MMKKILLLVMVVLMMAGGYVSAQETVYSRDASISAFWSDAANNPWYRDCDGWWIDRPDRSVCGDGTVIGPNNIFIGHNNNKNMVINGIWFQVQTLTLQAGADQQRTFTGSGSAGLSLYAGITNDANEYHIFNTEIGIDAATVTINANAGNLAFTQPVFLNANDVVFTGSHYTYVDGVVSGSGSLTKQGLGGLSLTGENTYTGTTTHSAGILLLGDNLASSAITVAAGAALYIGFTGAEADVTINDLTVSPGGIVSVYEGSTLTINGNLVNNGTFTIESSTAGTGSLITNGTVTGDIKVERYIDAYTEDYNGWHFVSSPLTSYTVSGSGFEPTGDDDLFMWSEADYEWKNYKLNPFNFTKGLGYLCAYKTARTNEFTGTINIADVAVGSLTDQGGADEGWNLVGNPFTSGLTWDITNPAWGTTDIGGVAKYLLVASGNYDDIAQGDVIPPAQGFLVEVSGGPGSLTFPTSARIHNTTWYKGAKSEVQTLKLKVSGGTKTYYDYTRVKFTESATEEYDMAFDSHKKFGDATAPQLFTKMGEENYSTNSFNYERSEKSVDLAFRAGTNGEHTIEVVLNTLEITDGVYLEDLVEDIVIDLSKTDTYTFSATTEDNENRFQLHFGATGVEGIETSNLQAYISGQNLMIIGEEGQAELSIFDIQGKQLLNESVQLTSDYKKSLYLPTGIYIVRIQMNDIVKTNKVIIK